jgi:hypothetical protein
MLVNSNKCFSLKIIRKLVINLQRRSEALTKQLSLTLQMTLRRLNTKFMS